MMGKRIEWLRVVSCTGKRRRGLWVERKNKEGEK